MFAKGGGGGGWKGWRTGAPLCHRVPQLVLRQTPVRAKACLSLPPGSVRTPAPSERRLSMPFMSQSECPRKPEFSGTNKTCPEALIITMDCEIRTLQVKKGRVELRKGKEGWWGWGRGGGRQTCWLLWGLVGRRWRWLVSRRCSPRLTSESRSSCPWGCWPLGRDTSSDTACPLRLWGTGDWLLGGH